jgi:hypothetical protein
MTIHLMKIHGYFIPDPKSPMSGILFSHLIRGRNASVEDLGVLGILAKAHNWELKAREATPEEMDCDDY